MYGTSCTLDTRQEKGAIERFRRSEGGGGANENQKVWK